MTNSIRQFFGLDLDNDTKIYAKFDQNSPWRFKSYGHACLLSDHKLHKLTTGR